VATLHFIGGKAGAGKTTLARALGRELPAIVICEDEWLSQTAPPIHNLGDYVEAARRLRTVLAPHIVQLPRLGVSVVIDFAANTRKDRTWVRSIFETASAEHVLHYLELDDESCKARVRLRNERKPDGIFYGEVTERQVEEVNRLVGPPGNDENFTVVTHSVSGL
jgi:predicted kinase